MYKIKSNKAFTIIELIVVMAIIGILVLLAIPKFMGYTKDAKLTKYVNNAKQLENASERYYMDKQEWPKLSNTPYTAEQVESFAQKIYDVTGKAAVLDSEGQYYDIDYDKLSKYVKVPDDKSNYIIQNPVGNVYVLEGMSTFAKTRISNNRPVAVISMTPNNNITTNTNITWSYSDSTDIDGDSIIAAEWQLDSNDISITPITLITTAGNHTMKLRVKDEHDSWSNWVSINFTVSSSINILTDKDSVTQGNFITFTIDLPNSAGSTVNISTTFGTLSKSVGITDSNGKLSFTLTSNSVGSSTVTVSCNGMTVSKTVNFNPVTYYYMKYTVEKYSLVQTGNSLTQGISDPNRTYSGYSSYYYDATTKTFWPIGEKKTVKVSEGGTLYNCSGTNYLSTIMSYYDYVFKYYNTQGYSYNATNSTNDNRGAYVETVIGTSTEYPNDGKFSDGYWYVKQGVAN